MRSKQKPGETRAFFVEENFGFSAIPAVQDSS